MKFNKKELDLLNLVIDYFLDDYIAGLEGIRPYVSDDEVGKLEKMKKRIQMKLKS